MTTSNRDREVLEAATDGPWNEYQCSVHSVHGTIAECKPVRKGQPNSNAWYIAHFSPTRVRALLRELELASEYGDGYHLDEPIPRCRYCGLMQPVVGKPAHTEDCEVAELERLRDTREGKG